MSIIVKWRCRQCRAKYRWRWHHLDCFASWITMHCPKCGNEQRQYMEIDEKGRFVEVKK